MSTGFQIIDYTYDEWVTPDYPPRGDEGVTFTLSAPEGKVWLGNLDRLEPVGQPAYFPTRGAPVATATVTDDGKTLNVSAGVDVPGPPWPSTEPTPELIPVHAFVRIRASVIDDA